MRSLAYRKEGEEMSCKLFNSACKQNGIDTVFISVLTVIYNTTSLLVLYFPDNKAEFRQHFYLQKLSEDNEVRQEVTKI